MLDVRGGDYEMSLVCTWGSLGDVGMCVMGGL